MNNDCLVTSEVIYQWILRVTKSRIKIIGKSHTEGPKIVTHGDECIISFRVRYFMFWTHNSTEQSSIAHFAIVAKVSRSWLSIVTSPRLICIIKWTRGTVIMTSFSSIV